MKIIANDIKVGNILEHDGRLWVVLSKEHTQPGKGGAYVPIEMKDLRDGRKHNIRLRSSENVERVRLDEKEYMYIYEDISGLTLMDPETSEQIIVQKELLGKSLVYLTDGMRLSVCLHDEEVVMIRLPEQVTLLVQETEPVVKGQTASASYKPAILENGVRIKVPPHIDTGVRIVVDTVNHEYITRAKD